MLHLGTAETKDRNKETSCKKCNVNFSFEPFSRPHPSNSGDLKYDVNILANYKEQKIVQAERNITVI